MSRPITLCTAQWADLSLEDTCKIAREMGYDGLEIATWGQVDVHKAASDDNYVKQVKDTLAKYGMGCWALAAHVAGQCVCDNWDVRLDGFAPADLAGKPEAIRAWAKEEMITTARAAKKLGVSILSRKPPRK